MATTNQNSLAAMLSDKRKLSDLGLSIQQYGVGALLVIARAYLGPLAAPRQAVLDKERAADTMKTGGLTPAQAALLGLALSKLAFEIGELALHNPDVRGDGQLPVFALDEQGYAPALSLAHIVAAKRWWTAHYGDEQMRVVDVEAPQAQLLIRARTQMYAATTRYSYPDPGVAMMKTTSRGCGCGSKSTSSPYSSPATLAPVTKVGKPAVKSCGCGGGGYVVPTPPPKTTSCGCGCGSAQKPSCSCGAPTSATYGDCPGTFAISCESKAALRQSAKTALCDFMRCLADTFAPEGRFDSEVLVQEQSTKRLVDCVGQIAASFLHAAPDALCGTDVTSTPSDCEPCCDYAVEGER